MAVTPTLRFEHYHPRNTLGVHERKPRLSWKLQDNSNFAQRGYEVELCRAAWTATQRPECETVRCISSQCTLVPWPLQQQLQSRETVTARIRVFNDHGNYSAWSAPVQLETGLLDRSDWACHRITAPWSAVDSGPVPEHLYRKTFEIGESVHKARLYITTQGVYEAELNGQKIGDYFMAPGWTAYEGRIQYQTYDVTSLLSKGLNCLGVRAAEGWFCGRIGFEGGHRNIWGPHVALLAQLEVVHTDGRSTTIGTDESWQVAEGPIRLAEIYDGEEYDSTLEIANWSSPALDPDSSWETVTIMDPLPELTALVAGFGEPVRRIEAVQPKTLIQTPLGKTIVDFGQNLVGYVRLSNMVGQRGHKVTVSHAEVLENDELGTRPLRVCKAKDEYCLKGDQIGEEYSPRFTFHGFRYVQVDGWPGDFQPSCIEAIVCHTDMKPAGSFSCSNEPLNQLYRNICWGMRGNFLSVPTDCPQRDERLGWSGDLAVFAPTATLLYDCFGILKNWLIDYEYDQNVLDGVPPMVSPNATLPDPVWCRRKPCAIWNDATILVPWELYQETGDTSILAQQYRSMTTYMSVLPRRKDRLTSLWEPSIFQLGDWLDPVAPPDRPWESNSDAQMIANMFLIHSLDLMVQISRLLMQESDHERFKKEAIAARKDFHHEYVTPSGRLVSDSQAAYALAICFDILNESQMQHAAERLVYLVRKKAFKIATGFAGTPFVCEALAKTGHLRVAYAMLLNEECPSWLYPVTMGATTVWERWDSMLPDGSINPGEMTSFNHYAFGAIAKFMYNRVAGLQRLSPGWTTCRIEPGNGVEFSRASASHETPRGTVCCSWSTATSESKEAKLSLRIVAPGGTEVEVVLPGNNEVTRLSGPGEWSFEQPFEPGDDSPILPLPPKS